ncbi:SDR family NAD(P)-dependent oxidoreductase [Dictyobacter formicarum]|uniref:Short-chain dehydrogenase n=1 Tax=Dictyobacter formicarum TaxID=2778368 RepID=A0ABQ3VBU6_9CHLR|nr:SDR family oxidoreductase [Dictyobacter formicarum]GHO83181.1 short-chain dehydrogenase [Dictyobacter formicarum]
MFTYQGKTALITGASSGIGQSFAYALAARNVNLILVARSEERLRALADDLAQRHAIKAEVIVSDLSQPQAAQTIRQEVEQRGLVVDMLINNAGFGLNGYFETIEPERDHQQVMVDVVSVVDMTHAFIPEMLKRGGGAIINVASTAGFQPLPYMAVYSASKAFVLSFSEALSEEYRQRGLRVLALCPGATETPFFEVASEAAAVGRKRTVEQVVATGLRALERGQRIAIDGRANALLAQLPRIFPRAIVARIAGQAVHPHEDKA